MTATIQHDIGSDSRDETKISTMVTKGKEFVVSASSSHSHSNTLNEESRIELFHVRVISNHTKADALFDSGSESNLILEDLVINLNLEIVLHHKPYPLGWIINMQIYRLQGNAYSSFSLLKSSLTKLSWM